MGFGASDARNWCGVVLTLPHSDVGSPSSQFYLKVTVMPLANGRSYLAIPGPSVIPDEVLQAMHRASPNIYEGELHDLTHSLIPDLKSVARTDGNVAIYIGNGHSAWEAALANVTSRGDKILVAAAGTFGHGWGEMASEMGLNVEVLEFPTNGPVNPSEVEEVLRADTAGDIKALLLCQVDTSTGAKSDVVAIRAAIDAAGHSALYLVDCIASLGCDRYEMDAWGVDVTVSACQKGLMTPAGLAFVHYNDKADARRGDNVTRYWDWRKRVNPEVYYQYFSGTAPTHHLYGLRKALDMINAEGIETVWDRHDALADMIWTAFEAWGDEGPMTLNVADRAHRSSAVTSIYAGPRNGAALQSWCKDQAGLTLGIGLGREPADAYFRLGHMGHVNAHMIMGALGTIEAGLFANRIPHGQGALSAAAKVLARHATAAQPRDAAVEAKGNSSHPQSARQCC